MTKVYRLGFTKLTPPSLSEDSPNPRLNIIFIHGLRGHPLKTWASSPSSASRVGEDDDGKKVVRLSSFFRRSRYRSSDASGKTQASEAHAARGVFWPQDFLAADVPGAAIWTYGYDADVVGGLFQANNQNSVSQHGRDLSVGLERDIGNENPFIFIVHSLGGIILKDAIRRSESTCKRTRLIMFLGTPHRGSAYADWGLIASNLTSIALQDPNKKVLRTLEVNDEVLDNIHELFISKAHSYNIPIHSFQEAKAMTGIKALNGKVVDDFSSKLGLPPALETVESIDANHRQMARFSSKDDQGYRAIKNILLRFMESKAEDAPQKENTAAKCGEPSNEKYRANSADVESLPGQSSRKLDPMMPDSISPAHQKPTPSVAHRSTTPSRISCNHVFEVPLLENARFTGRSDVMSKLETAIQASPGPSAQNRIVLTGLGGCGKTEVALQISYSYRRDFFGVFWVDATNEASIRSSFNRLHGLLRGFCAAENKKWDGKRERAFQTSSFSQSRLHLNNDEDYRPFLARIAQSTEVFDYIRHLPGSWLLVIDNMDDPALVSFIEKLLKQFASGVVLITTRNRAAGKLGLRIDIPEMSTADSVDLLLRSIDQHNGVQSSDLARARLLTEKLGHLPLAIDQAAAYINLCELTIDEYLQLFDSEADYLLDKSSENRYSHTKTEYEDGKYDTVLKTWELSFRHIQRSRTAAAELLQLLAFLYHENINEQVFARFKFPPSSQWSDSGDIGPFDSSGLDIPEKLQACLNSKREFMEAYGELLRFSLIKRKTDRKSLWIHPLVHYWTYARMSTHIRSRWLHIAMVFLSGAIPLKQQLPAFENADQPLPTCDHVRFLLDKLPHTVLRPATRNVVPVLFTIPYGNDEATTRRIHDSFDAISASLDDKSLDLMATLWKLVDSKRLPASLEAWEQTQTIVPSREARTSSPMLNALYLRVAFEIGFVLNSTPLSERTKDRTVLARTEALDRVVRRWKPVSESFLEAQAVGLQSLYFLEFNRAGSEQSAATTIAKLKRCLEQLGGVNSLRVLALKRLVSLSLISCEWDPADVRFSAVVYLMEQSRPVVGQTWEDVSRAISNVFSRTLRIEGDYKGQRHLYVQFLRDVREWERAIGEPVPVRNEAWEKAWRDTIRFFEKVPSPSIRAACVNVMDRFLAMPENLDWRLWAVGELNKDMK